MKKLIYYAMYSFAAPFFLLGMVAFVCHLFLGLGYSFAKKITRHIMTED